MKTNLDAIRKMDKSLLAIFLFDVYNARKYDDEVYDVYANIFKSLESTEEWLDFPLDK